MSDAPAAIDGNHFRHVLGHFLTGVTVITAIDPDSGEPVGMAASSFTSLSMDPPLVLFCAGNTSGTWARIQAAGRFAVNMLAEDGEVLSRQMSGRADKYEGVAWHAEQSGSPVLDDALAWIDCTIEAVHPGGDHAIVVGRVLGMDARDGVGPLAYYRGGYGSFRR